MENLQMYKDCIQLNFWKLENQIPNNTNLLNLQKYFALLQKEMDKKIKNAEQNETTIRREKATLWKKNFNLRQEVTEKNKIIEELKTQKFTLKNRVKQLQAELEISIINNIDEDSLMREVENSFEPDNSGFENSSNNEPDDPGFENFSTNEPLMSSTPQKMKISKISDSELQSSRNIELDDSGFQSSSNIDSENQGENNSCLK